MRLIGAIVLIIGVLALIVGVLYLAEPARSLPHFFPGYAAHVHAKHSKRGIAGVVVGAILVLLGGIGMARGGRRRVYY